MDNLKRRITLLLDEVEYKTKLWLQDPRPAFRQQLSAAKNEVFQLVIDTLPIHAEEYKRDIALQQYRDATKKLLSLRYSDGECDSVALTEFDDKVQDIEEELERKDDDDA